MTDNEIITEYDRDFFNNKISIGDRVVFEAPGYRHFVLGKVITKAPKSCQIEYINDWNYEGRTEVVRQGYGQIIKDHSDLINRQRAEIERLKSLESNVYETVEKLKNKIETEARKEFAERLVAIYENDKTYDRPNAHTLVMTLFRNIDNLVKEMENKP